MVAPRGLDMLLNLLTKMQPTQLSVAFMSLNIVHAYYARSTPIFLSWLATYSTSLLYHFTKQSAHTSKRLRLPIFILDSVAATTLFGVSFYEMASRGSQLAWMHLLYVLMYAAAYPFKVGVWSADVKRGEQWHALFHWLTFAQTHLYLSASVAPL
jgi:hypothetical protein